MIAIRCREAAQTSMTGGARRKRDPHREAKIICRRWGSKDMGSGKRDDALIFATNRQAISGCLRPSIAGYNERKWRNRDDPI